MKLYTSPGACSMTSHIVLEWLGKPYEAENITREQRKTPEFLALNPAGAVPVLTDGDWALTQNFAILNYLADSSPEAKLTGDGSPRARAEINRWLGFLNSDLHPAFKPFFGAVAYLGDETMIAKSHDNARQVIRKLFERADRQLCKQDWLAGFRSVADPYLFVMLRWAKGLGIDLTGLEGLARFEQRLRADPGVQAAMRAEGLDPAS